VSGSCSWFMTETLLCHLHNTSMYTRKQKARGEQMLAKENPPLLSKAQEYQRRRDVCVFITAVPITKLFAWGEGDSAGHVLRDTMSQGLSGPVCPSRTSERGGEGDCVKEGGGGEGKREKECALGLPLCHSP